MEHIGKCKNNRWIYTTLNKINLKKPSNFEASNQTWAVHDSDLNLQIDRYNSVFSAWTDKTLYDDITKQYVRNYMGYTVRNLNDADPELSIFLERFGNSFGQIKYVSILFRKLVLNSAW